MAGEKGNRNETVEVVGEVRAADLDRASFVLRLDDGTSVLCQFRAEQEATVTEALREHCRRRLRVRGRGEFTQPGRRLKRVAAVEEVRLEDDGARREAAGKPIWETMLEISASVPAEQWAKVPRDASINLDHYLYGASKREE